MKMTEMIKEGCCLTVGVWDANTALGDTIMEKYESLYIKLVELSNVLVAKGANEEGLMLEVCRSIGEIFISSSTRWNGPCPWETSQGRFDLGKMYKWHIYMDDALEEGVSYIYSDIGKAGLITCNLEI